MQIDQTRDRYEPLLAEQREIAARARTLTLLMAKTRQAVAEWAVVHGSLASDVSAGMSPNVTLLLSLATQIQRLAPDAGRGRRGPGRRGQDRKGREGDPGAGAAGDAREGQPGRWLSERSRTDAHGRAARHVEFGRPCPSMLAMTDRLQALTPDALALLDRHVGPRP